MLAEIINQAITTTAWTEIKSTKDIALGTIIAQAEDASTFKLSLTASDAAPFWTVKENAGLSPGEIRLQAGVKIIYAKAITANTTVQIAVKRR